MEEKESEEKNQKIEIEESPIEESEINENTKITKDMTIIEIIDLKPEAMEVLMDFGLGCFSCAFSELETLEQGCLAHGMPEKVVEKLVEEINKF